MTTAERVEHIRSELLNRPDEDDLFTEDDYYAALTRAARHYYGKVTAHYPELFYRTDVVEPNASGDTYTLTDDHMGEIEVWTPPGPPNGRQLSNVLPDALAFGFYIEGRNIRLTRAMRYTPGLYVRWVPATVEELTKENGKNSPLPIYCEEAECLWAAYLLAKRPGWLGNPEDFRIRARNAWSGDPDDPSDMGILGIISRQAATQGHQAAIGLGVAPWWEGIR